MKQRVSALADRLRRGVRERLRDSVQWEGVFASADEVKESGDGFAGDTWLTMTKNFTREALSRRAAGTLREFQRSDIQVLAMACIACARDRVRVLDFGGGMGIGYVLLRAALDPKVQLDYTVVEGDAVCRGGQALLGDDVRFLRAFPEGETFDIVYAGSSMQYIRDSAAVLARFASFQPLFILLGDVPAGDVPTFWTAQLTVPGSRIAYSFLNFDELAQTMSRLGYRLAVNGVTERPISVENLPSTHRVSRTSNLLFRP